MYPHQKEALIRYGISELESHEKCLAILVFYKVPLTAVVVLEGYNESTVAEARKLMPYLKLRRMQRLLVVTSNFHTRRTRMLFRRVFRETGIRVLVQATPPDNYFNPRDWWTRRRDIKTLLWEYQKLLFYALRYW
jgi:uncharacterized SAM-binding protein YcdF (DUF218 family)